MIKDESIIYGKRDETFKNFLFQILKRSKMRNNTIQTIINENVEMYSMAFTHPSADEENNYEYLELMGDSLVNNCIVWYLNGRFPQLRNPQCVKIIARLKINLVSKKSFYEFAEKMGMWSFVSASEDTKRTKMKKTLEDVFEAFFGATCLIVNERNGMGYNICYNIIKSLFDEIDISLKYEDLYDAKTRLKETFDLYKYLGKIQYSNQRIEDIQYVEIHMWNENGRILLGKGSSALKPDAEQKAATNALINLKERHNVSKPIPEIYYNL